MSKMKKVFDVTYNKGANEDDEVYISPFTALNGISHKPESKEELSIAGIQKSSSDLSYVTFYDKKFRIVVYIEE